MWRGSLVSFLLALLLAAGLALHLRLRADQTPDEGLPHMEPPPVPGMSGTR